MAADSTIDRQGFLAGRLNVGGVWYYRDADISKIEGLTQEDIDVYKRRGLINAHRMDENRPARGSNLAALVASKPVEPLTTGDVPGTTVPPVEPPSTPTSPVTENVPVAPVTEQASEAARLMAERAERAKAAIGAAVKGGKRG